MRQRKVKDMSLQPSAGALRVFRFCCSSCLVCAVVKVLGGQHLGTWTKEKSLGQHIWVAVKMMIPFGLP